MFLGFSLVNAYLAESLGKWAFQTKDQAAQELNERKEWLHSYMIAGMTVRQQTEALLAVREKKFRADLEALRENSKGASKEEEK